MNDTVGMVLRQKGADVWTVGPSDSVYDAITMMAERRVGALLVMSGDELVGVISERDCARKIVLHDRSSRKTLVSEIMTAPVIFVSPEQTVGEAMGIMTEHRVRHLPVMQRGMLAGVISIGDLVNWMIMAQRETIRHLEAYISGSPR